MPKTVPVVPSPITLTRSPISRSGDTAVEVTPAPTATRRPRRWVQLKLLFSPPPAVPAPPDTATKINVEDGKSEEKLRPKRRRKSKPRTPKKWAALENLLIYDRVRKEILAIDQGKHKEVDIQSLGVQERHNLLERLVRVADEDNERVLLKLRDCIEIVGIDLPTIEVRYENLNIAAEAYIGNRWLPTVLNSFTNTLEDDSTVRPSGIGKGHIVVGLVGKLSSDLKVHRGR